MSEFLEQRASGIWCRTCGGEGQIYKSRYSGNDPDVWPDRQCEACNGTGWQVCDYCQKADAVEDVGNGEKKSCACVHCLDDVK